MGRVPAARRAGGGASEKEARITDLKLWKLPFRERGPNHRNYVCDPLPSRSSASHGSERVLESSLDGLARHGIRSSKRIAGYERLTERTSARSGRARAGA
jgi:hypothetical protein